MIRMVQLNWGTLPTRSYFEIRFGLSLVDDRSAAHTQEAIRSGVIPIWHGNSEPKGRMAGTRPPAGDYTCAELWQEVNRLHMISQQNDEDRAMVAAEWVASILYVLGIEWV